MVIGIIRRPPVVTPNDIRRYSKSSQKRDKLIIPCPHFNSRKASALQKAAQILAEGGVVGTPTDTVYAIGASCKHPESIRRIYTVKERPPEKPICLCLSNLDQLKAAKPDFSPLLWNFMEKCYPGGISCVVPKGDWMYNLGVGDAYDIVGTKDSICIRVPDSSVLAYLVSVSGPIAITSGNPSGGADSIHHDMLINSLGNKLDAVILDGPSRELSASTVVNCMKIDHGEISYFRVGCTPKEKVDKHFEDAQAEIEGKTSYPPCPLYESRKSSDLRSVAAILSDGGVVGTPTDTVYAIGASCKHPESIRRIYTVKERPPEKPICLCLSNLDQLKAAKPDFSPLLWNFMEKCYPGGISCVVPKGDWMYNLGVGDAYDIVGTKDSICIRVPDSSVLAYLVSVSGPIAITSGNPSGGADSIHHDMLINSLGHKLDAMICDGASRELSASTVVNCMKIDQGEISYFRVGCTPMEKVDKHFEDAQAEIEGKTSYPPCPLYESRKSSDLRSVAAILSDGGVVGTPTDTVYAIGASCKHPESIRRIYTVKERPAEKPICLCLSNLDQLKAAKPDFSPLLWNFMEKCYPGGISCVVPKGDWMYNLGVGDAYDIVGTKDSICIRVPDSSVLAYLVSVSGPIAITSGNPSGGADSIHHDMLINSLGHKLDAIICDGASRELSASTVVNCMKIDQGEISYFRVGCTPKEKVDKHFEDAQAEIEGKTSYPPCPLYESRKSSDLRSVAAILSDGGVVGTPTDTVYAIGASCKHPESIRRIYTVKERPAEKPICLCLSNLDQLKAAKPDFSPLLWNFMEKCYPGGISCVVPKGDWMYNLGVGDAYDIVGTKDSICIRVPDSSVLAYLVSVSGPIAITSGNPSGGADSIHHDMLINSLAHKLDAIICDGASRELSASTVVNCMKIDQGEISYFRVGCTPKEKVDKHFEDAQAEIEGKTSYPPCPLYESRKSSDLRSVAAILSDGGVVGTPTDTVYAIGASCKHPESIRRIYIVKERPPEKPICLCLSNLDQLKAAKPDFSPLLWNFMEKCYPGGISCVVPKGDWMYNLGVGDAYDIVGTKDSICIRVPDSSVLAYLVSVSGPIAITSGNPSGGADSIHHDMLINSLGHKLDAMICDGASRELSASTVVNCMKIDQGEINYFRVGCTPKEKVDKHFEDAQAEIEGKTSYPPCPLYESRKSSDLRSVAAILSDGGVVGTPTDTVYAIGASCKHPESIRRIYTVKERPPEKPICLCLSNLDQLKAAKPDFSPLLWNFMEKCYPGGISCVVPKGDWMYNLGVGDAYDIVGTKDSICIRVPDSSVLAYLVSVSGPIAITSGNPSGGADSIHHDMLINSLGHKLDAMICDGASRELSASTVVNCMKIDQGEISYFRVGCTPKEKVDKHFEDAQAEIEGKTSYPPCPLYESRKSSDLRSVAAILSDGGVVGTPTDTVYAIGASCKHPESIRRIYTVKERPPEKPICLCLSNLDQLKAAKPDFSPLLWNFMEKCYPGGISCVVPKGDWMYNLGVGDAYDIVGTKDSICIRVPDSSVLAYLVSVSGPIAITSGNPSGGADSIHHDMLINSLGHKLDAMICDGASRELSASTVVNCMKIDQGEISYFRVGCTPKEKVDKHFEDAQAEIEGKTSYPPCPLYESRKSSDLRSVAAILSDGGVVGTPTDTVYAIGASCKHPESIRRIYTVKERPAEKPICLCLSNLDQLKAAKPDFSPLLWNFMEKCYPGGISCVVPKGDWMYNLGVGDAYDIVGTKDSICIRVPDSSVLAYLVSVSGPIAITSGNPSGGADSIHHDMLINSLGHKLDAMICDGASRELSASTVVNCMKIDQGEISYFRVGCTPKEKVDKHFEDAQAEIEGKTSYPPCPLYESRKSSDLRSVAAILSDGGVVGTPTDTVYAIGASCKHPESIRRIYTVKERPAEKPICLCLSNLDQLKAAKPDFSPLLWNFMEKCYPGGISCVVPKGDWMYNLGVGDAYDIVGTKDSICIRVPDSSVLAYLVSVSGPIAITSGNPSGGADSIHHDMLINSLGHKLDAMICDGASRELSASTVVNCMKIDQGEINYFRVGCTPKEKVDKHFEDAQAEIEGKTSYPPCPLYESRKSSDLRSVAAILSDGGVVGTPTDTVYAIGASCKHPESIRRIYTVKERPPEKPICLCLSNLDQLKAAKPDFSPLLWNFMEKCYPGGISCVVPKGDWMYNLGVGDAYDIVGTKDSICIRVPDSSVLAYLVSVSGPIAITSGNPSGGADSIHHDMLINSLGHKLDAMICDGASRELSASTVVNCMKIDQGEISYFRVGCTPKEKVDKHFEDAQAEIEGKTSYPPCPLYESRKSSDLRSVAAILSDGGVVGTPTDTVYAIGASCKHPESIRRIYTVKERPPEKPICLCLSNLDQLKAAKPDFSPLLWNFMEKCYPGGISCVVPKGDWMYNLGVGDAYDIVGTKDSICIRVPDSSVLAYLVSVSGPIAITSGNPSGGADSIHHDMLINSLGHKLDAMICDGASRELSASTVVNCMKIDQGEISYFRVGCTPKEKVDKHFEDAQAEIEGKTSYPPCPLYESRKSSNLRSVAAILSDGGVVGTPTDTVYAIGASCKHPESIRRIYTVKERPSEKPICLCLSNLDQLKAAKPDFSPLLWNFMEKCYPGGISCVVPKGDWMYNLGVGDAYDIVGTKDSICIRVPDSSVLAYLVSVSGPIAITSGNPSGGADSIHHDMLINSLGHRLDAMICDGASRELSASTVVNCIKIDQGEISYFRVGCTPKEKVDKHFEDAEAEIEGKTSYPPCPLYESRKSSDLRSVAAILSDGGVVGTPTDTVYAIGASCKHPESIRRIYTVKERPPEKPICLCLSNLDQLKAAKPDFSPLLWNFMEKCYPGGISCVVPKGDWMYNLGVGDAYDIVGTKDSICIRVPDSSVLAYLVSVSGPIAITSGNPSGGADSIHHDMLINSLGHKLDAMICDGASRELSASTVVNCMKIDQGEISYFRVGCTPKEKVDKHFEDAQAEIEGKTSYPPCPLYESRKSSDLRSVAAILSDGGVVGTPTDTVYAIGASCKHPESIRRIYTVKERPAEKPICLCLSNLDQLKAAKPDFSPLLWNFMEKCYPGGISCVVPKGDWMYNLGVGDAYDIVGTKDSICIRVPDSSVLAYLVSVSGPIAITSGNPSGGADSIHHDMLINSLGHKLDAMICDGASRELSASTVVNCMKIDQGEISYFRVGCTPKEKVDKHFEDAQAEIEGKTSYPPCPLYESRKSSDLRSVAAILSDGGVVGTPTDTVYAIGASCKHPESIRRIYTVKERPPEKPICLCLSNLDQLKAAKPDFSPLLWNFIEKCYPGGISCVVPKGDWMYNLGIGDAYDIVGTKDSVCIRIPDSSVLAYLVSVSGPIAITSGNPSGEADSTHHDMVINSLGSKLDAILCDGESDEKSASTVVNCLNVDRDGISYFRIGCTPRHTVDRHFRAARADIFGKKYVMDKMVPLFMMQGGA